MRLFLSSIQAGHYDKELCELFGKRAKVAAITNAWNSNFDKGYGDSAYESLSFLEKNGFVVNEIDLRKFFGKQDKLAEKLKEFDAVWFTGGNTFVLRRALKQSGADKLIVKMVKNNQLALGGESAGAIIQTPSLTGVQFGDDPEDIPSGYESEVLWGGLDLVKYHVVPHYKSAWEGAKDMIAELKKNKLKYKTLTDNQALIIDGDKEEFLQ